MHGEDLVVASGPISRASGCASCQRISIPGRRRAEERQRRGRCSAGRSPCGRRWRGHDRPPRATRRTAARLPASRHPGRFTPVRRHCRSPAKRSSACNSSADERHQWHVVAGLKGLRIGRSRRPAPRASRHRPAARVRARRDASGLAPVLPGWPRRRARCGRRAGRCSNTRLPRPARPRGAGAAWAARHRANPPPPRSTTTSNDIWACCSRRTRALRAVGARRRGVRCGRCRGRDHVLLSASSATQRCGSRPRRSSSRTGGRAAGQLMAVTKRRPRPPPVGRCHHHCRPRNRTPAARRRRRRSAG